MARNYKQGLFRPSNPSKYVGDVNNIVYRSSWEFRFFQWCDVNPAVVSWQSEETVIPYICETDNKMHRYFVDVKLRIRDAKGNIGTFLVEIKPYAQTIPPKHSGKKTRLYEQRYMQEVETFVKNQSKWKAARAYAEQRGMKFLVLTEKELFGTK